MTEKSVEAVSDFTANDKGGEHLGPGKIELLGKRSRGGQSIRGGMVAIVVVQTVGEGAVDESSIARAGGFDCAPDRASAGARICAGELQQIHADFLAGRKHRDAQAVEDRQLGVFKRLVRRRWQNKAGCEVGEFFGKLLPRVRELL
jgi:hypothetical protein